MSQELNIAAVAALIGEPCRAYILSALMSGEALPASELAYRAYITPQTTSTHLAKLLAGNLIKVTKVGRHRYYSLKNRDVAQILENLQLIAPVSNPKTNRKNNIPHELCLARTCYDHLAGKLGVALARVLSEQEYLRQVDDAYLLTPKGDKLLEGWQIDVTELKRQRRKFAYPCLDWSERQFHVAGALGARITDLFFENKWIKRMPHTRALLLTRIGEKILKQDFGIVLQKID